ncbi:hypothetical protein PHK61_18540 [Actinomycetospora lutea]|uniref:hypothetical protein n=1 Tax=Actinomycetospora lutea TaxID=663604 RepID=UPI002365C100|nr:hypothetical protein [Actinomycetospora lutea]MDD7940428.1 hypothetical protein [Actinomycetospora lutea]
MRGGQPTPPHQGVVVPGLFSKIQEFLRSPQGKKYTDQAKRYAQDPKNRQKAQDALNKFRGKGGGQGGGHH